jgi:hypothetical protein
MAGILGPEGMPETPTVYLPIEERFYTYNAATGGIHVYLSTLHANGDPRKSQMIMKITITYLFAALACGCGAQNSRNQWHATVTVLDEMSEPVAGASVRMSWYIKTPDGYPTFDKVDGLTSPKGMVELSHLANGSIDLGFRATKKGYYPSSAAHEFGKFRDDDPAKWTPKIRLILKRIGTPIPMYAKSVNLGMPVFDKAAGYDLMNGDWVAPYGTGISTDILFTGHLNKRSEFDSDYQLVVSFPNQGDGIKDFTVPDEEKGSGLRSAHEAPSDGYLVEWIQRDIRRPTNSKMTDRDEHRSYYFRVRTVLDEHGNVKSALYGKIYGDFMQFRYYLNPTPNDRNVEFDPKHNLFKGERIDAP